MTNPFSDSVSKDVWYPDDLPELGRVELVSDAPIPAEEVEIEEAQYGQWIEVRNGQDDPVFAAAPTDLRAFLGEAIEEHGTTDLVFEVTEISKGPADHDPYEIEALLTHADGESVE